MNAAVVYGFDNPPRYSDFADPVAAEGERVLRVRAAGLHQVVRSLAGGRHYAGTGELPFVPGVDGVGELEDGRRVFFGVSRPPYGSFAERTVAAEWLCIPLPEQLDDAAAAGIANPGMSSWAALKFRAELVAGENVLILGATGVAGQLAVQITRRLGARRVVAAGRNVPALERLKTLGADAVINLAEEPEAIVRSLRQECAENGVDVVLDYLWGAPAECMLQAISQKGLPQRSRRIRYVQIGAVAGTTISLNAETLRSSGLELVGSGFGSVKLELIVQSVQEFFKEAALRPFQIAVKTAPLRDVEALWNSSEPGTRLVFQP
jgi:NADPH:quinone reductase-like Zn-dependent oxidoreductase